MADPLTLTRRHLLATAAAFACLPVAAAANPPGRFRLVNGWILTTRDLEALRLDDL